MTHHTRDPAETVALGRQLAQSLTPGDVVAFHGDLGAGKTTMIKGICAGLGVADTVKSPSFVIVTEYRGRLPVYHLDLYRLTGPADLEGLDFESYIDGPGVCLVEWAERAAGALPARTITVRLTVAGAGRDVEVIDPA